MEPTLHGRDEPLQRLRDALAGARAGRGRLALVSGEAGIGKSALAGAIAAEAEAAGASVTWGRGWEFAEAPPYFPVMPCLRALALAPAGDAFELWESVASSLAQRASTVWIVEDLHVADLGTLDLLTFLAEPLRSMPALVIATVRPEDPRLTERMRQRLARMARAGLDLRLAPLGDRDVAALTEATTGRAVPASALGRLVELTGGNPLFVVECARTFKSAGGIEGTLDTVPSTVRQVVLDRLALLSTTTQKTLVCGAVLGRDFSAALVARMQGTLPARAIDDLLPALRAGLVVENDPGLFAFKHAIVRDAVEGSLSADDLAKTHARAESALASMGDGAEVLLERARHALEALRAGLSADAALDLVRRSTEILEREGAFDRVFELSQRASAARAAGLLPPATPEASMHHASVARRAGRSDVMRRICEDLVARARVAPEPELFARAALLHASEIRPGVIDRLEVALLEEALALAPSGPLGCRVLARLATAIQPAPDQAVPARLARDALAKARASGDEHALLEVLENARWGLYVLGPRDERVAIARELVERATLAGDVAKALQGRWSLACYHVEASDFAGFDREVDAMLAIGTHPRDRWRALLLASMRALMKGDFVESDRHFTEASQLGGLVDDRAFPLSLAVHDVMRKRLQRRDDEARAALEGAEVLMRDLADAAIQIALLRASCAAWSGDEAATREALAVIGGQRAPLADPAAAALLAHAYAVAGTDEQRRDARAIVAAWESREIEPDIVGFVYDGATARLLGLLDASLGDLERAEAHLRDAHALAVERGHAPWAAQVACELAVVLQRRGRAEEARAFAQRAASTARDLAMTSLEAEALRVTGARAPAPIDEAAVQMTKSSGQWTVQWGASRVTVKDSRGMQLLSRLVERPGEEIHVLSLASDTGASLVETNAGEALDDRARSEYRARLSVLDEELAEAERHADGGRAAKLRGERELLLAELGRAFGLGGRSRAAASATERARVNVQRRLKDAIGRVAEADARLGRHLERSVRSGTFCCFRP
ncbi:MAG: AAA family ATPase [Labilithrix sp.]|nr:AAA family ATPase [Labilithrix sp.]